MAARAGASPDTWIYFCPRSNVVLEFAEDQEGAASSRRNSSDSPEHVEDLESERLTPTALRVKLTDCSDRRFLCARARHETLNGAEGVAAFAVPRVLKGEREYQFQGMRLLTRTARFFYAQADRRPVTVTVWQSGADGQHVPIELTLAPERGVVFIDGLRLGGNVNEAEACALQGSTGFFQETRVRVR